MAKDKAMRCGDCRWWNSGFSAWSTLVCPEGFGECRAKAPCGPWHFGTMSGDDSPMMASIMNAFPMVAEDDWCGEFQPTTEDE